MAKTALVTGGARGIGKAIVEELTRKGYAAAFSYLNSEKEAQTLVQETGAIAIRADLREEEQVNKLIRSAVSSLGHLDQVVMNAGISSWGLTQDMSVRDWDEVMNVNLRGAFLTARAAIPHLLSRKKGSLLFVSSIWGIHGAACEAAYSSSKAGLIALTQALAAELGPSSIRVNAIAPGVIKTDMLNGFSQAELDDLAERCPLGRIGKPEEAAKAACFLLSNQASYITGQVLAVDGGFK